MIEQLAILQDHRAFIDLRLAPLSCVFRFPSPAGASAVEYSVLENLKVVPEYVAMTQFDSLAVWGAIIFSDILIILHAYSLRRNGTWLRTCGNVLREENHHIFFIFEPVAVASKWIVWSGFLLLSVWWGSCCHMALKESCQRKGILCIFHLQKDSYCRQRYYLQV